MAQGQENDVLERLRDHLRQIDKLRPNP